MSQFVIVLVSFVFHVTVKYVFQVSYCTFSKCSLGLTHCRVNLYTFSFSYFSLQQTLFPCEPKVFRTILSCNHSLKWTNCFLGIFCFHPFCIYSSIKQAWRTRRYFTPLLSLASLSTYAKSIHHISFLNLANAFICLNLPVVSVNFVWESFECKNCLTVETYRLLAFTKLRTDP